MNPSRRLVFLGCLALALAWPQAGAAGDEGRRKERAEMVARQIKARGVRDGRVLAAMGRVPRHEFVPRAFLDSAYADQPLPIGYGQTISQPYIVAYMTEVLALTGREKVLEIGTGSGYQAAVLAETAGRVRSIEIIPELYAEAKGRLERLGFDKVKLKAGDGYFGWPEEGPFEAIVVTCAAGHVPPPLIEQLKPGGRMVIPVGPPMFVQTLVLVEKTAEGQVRTENLMSVRFVPLVRGRE